MKHTIISWDCSFRNFFHLIDGLLDQEYYRNEFELIYVEQRTEEAVSAYNHKLGLKSLRDRYEKVKDRINIRIIYLGDDKKIPYHLGKCNNKGIELAKGEIISVMDGDLLLSPNFLTVLEEYHRNHNTAVLNILRHMANYPIDVKKENWTEGVIDYVSCLEACSTRNNPIPRRVDNKGPLISARKEYWEMVGGYDMHPIWSTGLSRLGQDVNARLEILTGFQSKTLPNAFAVHPYHPSGFLRISRNSKKLLGLQMNLINWTRLNKEHSWKKRINYTELLFNRNRKFIEGMIYSERLISSGKQVPKLDPFLISITLICNKVIGKLFKTIKNLLSRI